MGLTIGRKYGTGTGADIYIPIVKRASVDYAVGSDWTPASGDVVVKVDGNAAVNIGTLPSAVTMGNTAWWKFVFSNAELQGKSIAVSVSDASTKVVEDTGFIIETYGHASAMYQADLSAANLSANVVQLGGVTQSATDLKDFADAGYDPATHKVQGVVLTDTMTAYTGNTPQTGDSFALIGTAGAGLTALSTQVSVDALGTSLGSIATGVTTIAGYVDTEIQQIIGLLDNEIAQIKAKTDTIPASPAATGDIPTADENADALLDRAAAIDGKTPREAWQIIGATTAGKLSGAGSATEVFVGLDGLTVRVTGTVDGSGNRTDVVYA